MHIRDRALVFDGRKPHSSGVFNGDRCSLVLLVHSSWEFVTPAMRRQLLDFGLPCPPIGPTQVALPAVEGATPLQGGLPPDDAAAPPVDVLDEESVAVKTAKPKDTLEVAQSREHQMTHLPKTPNVTSALKQRCNVNSNGERLQNSSQTRSAENCQRYLVSK